MKPKLRSRLFSVSMILTLRLALAVLVPAADARAEANWPQFRGPGGEGHADGADLPIRWDDETNITWFGAIRGTGWSSPVVLGERIYLTTANDDGRSLGVVCLRLDDGRILYEAEVFRIGAAGAKHAKNSYASPTPVIEGDRLYVSFGTHGAACVEAHSGRVLWTNTEHKIDHEVGPGSSPMLYGDLLILPYDGTDLQFVVALDKKTGKTTWKTKRSAVIQKPGEQKKAFSTPLVINVDGKDQIVIPGAERVSAYEPLTGKEIWWVNYGGFSNVPRPVYGHGLVYVCTGFQTAHLLAIDPRGTGDLTDTNIRWRWDRQAPLNPSPILVGDELYFVSNRGIGTCLDARTGTELWTKRLGGDYSASPIHASGRIYFFSEQGTTTVLAAGREYEKLAENELEGIIMATPAVAEDAFILRTDENLYRIEETGGGEN